LKASFFLLSHWYKSEWFTLHGKCTSSQGLQKEDKLILAILTPFFYSLFLIFRLSYVRIQTHHPLNLQIYRFLSLLIHSYNLFVFIFSIFYFLFWHSLISLMVFILNWFDFLIHFHSFMIVYLILIQSPIHFSFLFYFSFCAYLSYACLLSLLIFLFSCLSFYSLLFIFLFLFFLNHLGFFVLLPIKLMQNSLLKTKAKFFEAINILIIWPVLHFEHFPIRL